jgi:hypothetical protein
VFFPRALCSGLGSALALAGLTASAIFSGCAIAPLASVKHAQPVADLSPVPLELSPGDAWRAAEACAFSHPGSRVMVGNAEPDRTPVRFSNYVGTVIGAFVPRDEIAKTVIFTADPQRIAIAE